MKKLMLALWVLIVGVVAPATGQEGECGEWAYEPC